MPGGVVFLVCIPTLNHEHELIFGTPAKTWKKPDKPNSKLEGSGLKVDLRLKEIKTQKQLITLDQDLNDVEEMDETYKIPKPRHPRVRGLATGNTNKKSPIFVSMETVCSMTLIWISR